MHNLGPGAHALARARALSRVGSIVALGVCTACALAGCGHVKAPASGNEPPASNNSPNPLSVLGGFVSSSGNTLVERSGSRIVWELKSPQISISVTDRTGIVRSVDGVLYSGGKPGIRIQAPEAQINSPEHTLTLARGVRAEGLAQKGLSFRADRMVWRWLDPDGIEATGHVHFQRGQAQVDAGRMVADAALKRARLTGHPVATAVVQTGA